MRTWKAPFAATFPATVSAHTQAEAITRPAGFTADTLHNITRANQFRGVEIDSGWAHGAVREHGPLPRPRAVPRVGRDTVEYRPRPRDGLRSHVIPAVPCELDAFFELVGEVAEVDSFGHGG